MILKSPSDVAFSIWGFPVYWYGIILAFACFVAVFIAQRVYSKIYKPDTKEAILELAPFVVILGILGARLYYCFLNFSYYFVNPIEIFYIRGGGLSIHGALIAGILGLWIASKKYKINFASLLDVFAVGTVFAQSVGRWGNFFNNEAFGLPYDGFLKLYIPLKNRPLGFENVEFYHPTFLYESLLDLLIFGVLLFVINKFGTKFKGLTLALYLILYSLARFLVEGLRMDSALNIAGVHVAQIISVLIFVFAFVLALFVFFKKSKSFPNN